MAKWYKRNKTFQCMPLLENNNSIIFNIFADQTPEITELESGGLCDFKHSSCSTVKVLGKGFRNTFELKCEVMKEKVKSFSTLLLICVLYSWTYLCVQCVFFCTDSRWWVVTEWSSDGSCVVLQLLCFRVPAPCWRCAVWWCPSPTCHSLANQGAC